jgi:hypothetical protein
MASNQFLEYCPLQSLEVTSQMEFWEKNKISFPRRN